MPQLEWNRGGFINLVWVISGSYQDLKISFLDEWTLVVRLVTRRPQYTESEVLDLIGVQILFDMPHWPFDDEDFTRESTVARATIKLHKPIVRDYAEKRKVGDLVWFKAPMLNVLPIKREL